MDERCVRFFHKRLPVRGDAMPIRFKDSQYRFWEVRTRDGEGILIFREMIGTVSIQERFDYWLKHECNAMPVAGLAMCYADHIAPAGVDAIKRWAEGHAKQMKNFDLAAAMREAQLG